MSIKLSNPLKNGITMEQINQTINESEDLIVALESIAAMYGIPSSHILADPTSKSIRVEGDMIVAPPVGNVSGNAKAIIQSIGAVIDHVSQRVDDRINDFQNDNIRKNKLQNNMSREADPSKGKVVSRHVNDDGEEIIVYDSGLIDMPNTPTANAFVSALREKGVIPDYKSEDEDKMSTDSLDDYFGDINDITKGINILDEKETEDTDDTRDIGGGMSAEETNIANFVGESYETISLISEYNDTRNLGYAIMQEQGFDFVKPVLLQEADESTKLNYTDLSYCKFDNSQILQAIKLINEIKNGKNGEDAENKLDYKALVRDKRFQEAIDCLNKQFDCRINLRFFKDTENNPKDNQLATRLYGDIKTNLTVSKSKGFQLHGLPIEIFSVNTMLEEDAPSDPTLFGQHVVALLCHEIFHNIATMIRVNNNCFNTCLTSSIELAVKATDPADKRKIFTNLLDTLDEVHGVKIPAAKRKKAVTQLACLSAVTDDEEAMKAIRDNKKGKIKSTKRSAITTGDSVEDQIKKYKKTAKKLEFQKSTKKGANIATIAGIAASIIAAAAGAGIAAVAPLGLTAIGTGINIATNVKFNKKLASYKHGDKKNLEEYYCDLFAGMYNLPPTFFIAGTPRKGASNDVRIEQLKELDALERQIRQYTMSTYPTMGERNYAAVKMARSTLTKNKNLDPAFKKYLEWIIDNYSSNEKLNIGMIYNKTTFDPHSAEDLDHHLQMLVSKNNITVTEYDLSWLYEDNETE